jgi:hypothetical protein
MSKLLQDPDFFEEQGRLMEMMRLAAQGAKEELGSYHTYADGKVDRIILSHETVGDE